MPLAPFVPEFVTFRIFHFRSRKRGRMAVSHRLPWAAARWFTTFPRGTGWRDGTLFWNPGRTFGANCSITGGRSPKLRTAREDGARTGSDVRAPGTAPRLAGRACGGRHRVASPVRADAGSAYVTGARRALFLLRLRDRWRRRRRGEWRRAGPGGERSDPGGPWASPPASSFPLGPRGAGS